MQNALCLAAIAATAAFTSAGFAATATIIDTTPGGATNDGVIGVGEYVGSTVGINTGFGDVLGASSTLYVDSSSAGGLFFGLDAGPGTFENQVVIYIDSIAGGVSDTVGLTDTADTLRRAISGNGGSGGADIQFAPGFTADYAIAFAPENSFGGLWSLTDGANLPFQRSVNLTPAGDIAAGAYEMDLLLSDIGLNLGDSFRYVVTYLNADDDPPFRSNEFHGVADGTLSAGNPGRDLVVLAEGDFNTFVSVPEPASLSLLGLGGMGLLRRRR